jgi:hypothetical protein
MQLDPPLRQKYPLKIIDMTCNAPGSACSLSLCVNKLNIPDFIKYSVHTSIVCTLILQKIVNYPVNLKPFIRYLHNFL